MNGVFKATFKKADGQEIRKTFRSILECAAWIEAHREEITEASVHMTDAQKIRQEREE